MGESPAGYFRRLKMNEAEKLLRSGAMSVKEVAYRLGYRHPGDFGRAFKSFSGFTPKIRRRRQPLFIS